MRTYCTRLGALAAVLVLLGAAMVGAAPITEKPKVDSPVEKLRKALDQTIDLDLTDQSLALAVTQLREQTRINFVIDQVTLAGLGMDPNATTAINLKLGTVKVRTALRSILNQLNLSYALIGDTVIITSEEMAIYRQLRQRVSVDLAGVKLDVAVKQLARETGTNLLIDPRSVKEAQASITLQLDDVPLDTAIRLMAEMAGLKPVRLGNVLMVTTRTAATELRSEPELLATPKPATGVDELIVPAPAVRPGGVVPAVPIAPPAADPPPADKPAEKPREKPPEKPGEPKP